MQNINDNEDNNYIILSENLVIKKILDEYLKSKNINKQKIKLSFDEKKKLLFDYIKENNKIPLITENKDLSIWFTNQKKHINSCENTIYKSLSSNIIIKKNLDRYLENKKKPELTKEEKIKKIIEYCNKNGKIPVKRNKEDCGDLLSRLKDKIKSKEDEDYILLSENELVKKSIDNLLEKRKSK